MTKKIFKKLVVLSTSSTLLFGATIPIMAVKQVPMISLNQNKTNSIDNQTKELVLSRIKDELQKYSFEVQENEQYKYDGLVFNSTQEVDEYIFNKQKVLMHATSSNPNKIIRDSETGILDQDKIYGTNIDEFEQYFEDAYGNAVKSKEEALKTFVKSSDYDTEYSFDGIDWYESELDAIKAKKKKMSVSKSLYYLFGGKYYNAFNENDINILLSKMKEGFFANFDKDLAGNQKNSIDEGSSFFAERDNFIDLAKKYFRTDFVNSYHKDLLEFKGSNNLKIIKPEYISSFDVLTNKDFLKNASEFTLKFGPKYSSYSEMVSDFSDLSKWTKIKAEINIPNSNKKFSGHSYEREFITYPLNEYSSEKVKITVTPSLLVKVSDKVIVERWQPQLDFKKHMKFNEESIGNLFYYFDKNKTKRWISKNHGESKGLYGTHLTHDQILEFYDVWSKEYLNKVILNFEHNRNKRVTWNDLKNQFYVKNTHSELLAGEVLKDKLYEVNPGKGYTNSLVQSMKNWQIKKEEIIFLAEQSEDFEIIGEKKYEIFKDFKVTREDLDNFLNLEGVGVDARMMYVISEKEHASDLTGKFLAPTEIQAKELKRLFSDNTLKKRYIIHDNFDNKYPPVSGNVQDVIAKIKSEIKLNSKFVNKEEASQWGTNIGRKPKWINIVSDNYYHVYSISNPNTPWDETNRLFYISKQKALDSLKTTLKIDRNYRNLAFRESYKIYNFIFVQREQKIILPIKYRESEVNDIALQIYNHKIKNR